jgi:hypothetical protein
VSNPYQAPGAVVADRDNPKGSPVKAVIYGVLVDIIGSTIAGAVLVFVYGIILATRGASPEAIAAAVTTADPTSAFSLAGTAIGLGFSCLGGYVCARVVREAELKWAAVTAAISITIGFGLGMQSLSVGVNLLFAVLGVAVVMLGGYAGARRNATAASAAR